MNMINSYFYIISFIVGAVVGSFLNVCIYRMPKDESVVFPPSHCQKCNYKIRWFDNIPILSYMMLRGKCRQCGETISLQYPLVELLNGIFSLLLFLKFGISLTFLIIFIFVSSLVVITFIDIEHQIIPDEISLSGIIAGFAASFFLPFNNWLSSIIGILIGGGSLYLVAWLYFKLTAKDGMGGGDIKLLAMIGAFLGWKAVPFVIFVSSLAGSIIGVTIMLLQKKDSKFAIPFGPYLALGAIIYLFYGKELILWYLNLGGFRG